MSDPKLPPIASIDGCINCGEVKLPLAGIGTGQSVDGIQAPKLPFGKPTGRDGGRGGK